MSLHDPSEPLHSFKSVEADLIEAAALWRASPRVGHVPLRAAWPDTVGFTVLGDYDAGGGDRIVAEPARRALSRDEVAFRDRVGEWLGLVPDPLNRRIVGMAIMARAGGQSQIPWKTIAVHLRQELTPAAIRAGYEKGDPADVRGGLRQRYNRAITAISFAMNKPGRG